MDRPLSYGEKMLTGAKRQLVIKRKAALEKVIIWYAGTLEEPMPEPTDEPNLVRFFKARDNFFRHMRNDSKARLVAAILKIVISELKHDPVWTDWGSWFIDELNRLSWQPLPSDRPSGMWEA